VSRPLTCGDLSAWSQGLIDPTAKAPALGAQDSVRSGDGSSIPPQRHQLSSPSAVAAADRANRVNRNRSAAGRDSSCSAAAKAAAADRQQGARSREPFSRALRTSAQQVLAASRCGSALGHAAESPGSSEAGPFVRQQIRMPPAWNSRSAAAGHRLVRLTGRCRIASIEEYVLRIKIIRRSTWEYPR
jgi:hypothetical protein